MRRLDRYWVWVGATVALLGLLPLGARLWWVLDLTSHFRLQYLLVAGVALLVLALRRQWRAAAALLAIAAINAWAVLPYLPQPLPSAAAVTAAPLKIMAVNISFRPFSARRFLGIVAEAAPDVLIVEEFTPHALEVLADLDQSFAYHLKAPAPGPRGIAVWSRYELAPATLLALDNVQAIEARISAPSGIFTLLGVHLSAPTSARRAAQRNRELELLAEHRATIDGPLVVAGDFNVTPYSPFYADWLAQTRLRDTRYHRTFGATWPTYLPFLGIPIDHIAVSPEFQTIAHRRLPNFDSDHYGILAEIALQGSAKTP